VIKHFGAARAVDRLDLTVPAGGIYGLLGPNGAGKTTLLRILATLLRADGGSARVFGDDVTDDPGAVRRRISLTGQFAAVDGDLTGTENLRLLARLRGFPRRSAAERAAELLAAFELSDAADRPVKTYSGGMRRRLDIASSMVVLPDLLFLDEPTTGLDPHSRNEVWGLVRAAVEDGTTVLLTTQYLDEADQLADRIAVMGKGRLIAEGTPGELKAKTGGGRLEVRLRDPRDRSEAERLISSVLGSLTGPSRDASMVSGPIADFENVHKVLAELRVAGIDITGFSVGQPRLDEVFLALTGARHVNALDLTEAA
jgi:ABC-2 type transport system ATP-binding protein